MKILLISNYCEGVGGISVQVKSLRDHLRGEGYTADIFSTKGSTFFRIKAFFRLLFSGRTYDVFHIHACSFRGFLPAVFGIIVGKFLRKRIILTYHGGDADSFLMKRPKFVSFFLRKTDVNIVLSGYLAKVFDAKNISNIIIPNIIELEGNHFRQRENIKPKFICIRSHTKIYNIECILTAFSEVKKKIPEAQLTLLGDGPVHQELVNYVTCNGIKDVSFVGQVDNTQIYGYLDNSDIMVSSPLIDNMPVSILEGFNAGLLVISSNVGGVPYMIQNGVNGLLFESRNVQQMADRMLWAIENQELVKEMISKARTSLNDYVWESIWIKLKEAYGI